MTDIKEIGVPIFQFNTHVLGGTEYQAKYFHEHILPEVPNLQKYVCMILPGKNLSNENLEKLDNEIIMWVHCLPSQFDKGLTELFWSGKNFSDRIKYIIVPSEYAKKKFIEETGFPKEKIYVIHNGIEALKYNPNKFKNVDQIKMVHTSGPNRGMIILLNSLQYIKHDFQLKIFNDFYPEMYLDNEMSNDNRVLFYGKTPRKTMYKYLEAAHVHAYPPIFLETFCIAIAESMSAGLLPIYGNIGALPEIVGNRGIYVDDIDSKFLEDGVFIGDKYAREFADKLSEGFDLILSNKWDPSEQINHINTNYSWEKVKQQWKDFNELL